MCEIIETKKKPSSKKKKTTTAKFQPSIFYQSFGFFRRTNQVYKQFLLTEP